MYEELSTSRLVPTIQSLSCFEDATHDDYHTNEPLDSRHKDTDENKIFLNPLEHTIASSACNSMNKSNAEASFTEMIATEKHDAEESVKDSFADSETDEDREDHGKDAGEEMLNENDSTKADEDIHQLNKDDLLKKLHDEDVCVDSDVLKDIQHIGLSTLQKLQNLSRTNPVVRKLFSNNRLTSREVKTTAIDPDIKFLVNEFLKNNIVGNFIISRVLRENYATFYGWLSTHLQCERNSWAVRLKQTLENYETLRRAHNENHETIVDSVLRLETLLHFSNHPLDVDTSVNKKNLPNVQPIPVLNRCLPKLKVSITRGEFLNQESEMEVNNSDSCKPIITQRDEDYEGMRNTHPVKGSNSNYRDVLESLRENHSVLDSEDTTNWKEVLRNSIQQLESSHRVLLSERSECLNYLGVGSAHSLCEALSTFVNERNISGEIKKKDIEQRLLLLEAENKELIKEMTLLQNTLKDKNKDALHLQKQLDNLEELISAASNNKIHRCVGTDDDETGAYQRSSKYEASLKQNKTPYRYKMISNTSRLVKQVYAENEEMANNLIESEKKHIQQSKDNQLRNTPTKLNTSGNAEIAISNKHLKYCREKSIIEISEEKLNVLKQRARKLEDSLHEAISSMTSMQSDKSPLTESQWQDSVIRHQANRHMIAPLQVKGSTPRLAVIRRPLSQRRSRSETQLESEPTSFLTGRSFALHNQTPSDRLLANFCLTVTAEKSQNKQVQDQQKATQHNDDEHESMATFRQDKDHGQTVKAPAAKVKVISRYRAAGNATVSKCLRCQKLFCAVDNHKLACLYHTKEKERIEHYDQSGKLLRITQAWMCCHQPQEIEGCCYGKHV